MSQLSRLMKRPKMKTVLFFREGMFYPIDVREDEDLAKHAELNPGTLRIEDIRGKVLWQPQ